MTHDECQTLKGIPAAPGICIGKAYLVDREGVEVIQQYVIPKNQLTCEVKRFKMAVNDAKKELRSVIEDSPEELKGHANILETHLHLLKDKMLYGRVIDTIETQNINAEWALKNVVGEVQSMFQQMTDGYLKERSNDVGQVADRIMSSLIGRRQVDISEIDRRVILVAHELSPAQTSQIRLERIMGFVTDRGGKASHTGIIARTLQIPAVVGSESATRKIRNDDLLIVDGGSGTIFINPDEETLAEYIERQDSYEGRKRAATRNAHQPATTRDGRTIEVMGNIELHEEVVSVRDYGGDGIGLYRSEFQYLSRSDFPTESELLDNYKDVIDVMNPQPVTIRTLDINGDKALARTTNNGEVNPALGLRAIRYCLKRPDVFRTQLRAILRAAAHGQVRILLPLISGVEEVIQAKVLLKEAADSLEAENIPYGKNVPVGAMIEVPSAVITADLIAKEVDYFSIGTNDLIQYAMAIDRGNRQVAYLYQPLHPAVLRMLDSIAKVGHQYGIEVYMCGEMAGEALYTPILLGLGIDELSMNPGSVPLIKSMIRELDMQQCQRFVTQVFELSAPQAVEQAIWDTFGDLLSETAYA